MTNTTEAQAWAERARAAFEEAKRTLDEAVEKRPEIAADIEAARTVARGVDGRLSEMIRLAEFWASVAPDAHMSAREIATAECEQRKAIARLCEMGTKAIRDSLGPDVNKRNAAAATAASEEQ